MKAAVLAIVLEAVQRIAKRALKSSALIVVAAVAFIGIFFLAIPFPLIIGAAGAIGFIGQKLKPGWFKAGAGHGAKDGVANARPALIDAAFARSIPAHVEPSLGA